MEGWYFTRGGGIYEVDYSYLMTPTSLLYNTIRFVTIESPAVPLAVATSLCSHVVKVSKIL